MSEADAKHIKSPEIHDDGSVTLRLKAQNAETVVVSLSRMKIPLQRGDDGLWSVTTRPLEPGIYEYAFEVDGTRMIDPSNRNVKKWFSLTSLLEVPGDPPRVTEFTRVPHGAVHRLIYSSGSVGHERPVVVYTPPGYSATEDDYPFVLLLHGFGDDETAWTEVGRAHLITDNLIARGKIRKCVIAMPYGHPISAPYGDRPKGYFDDNAKLYEKDIMTDLMPFLQNSFRISSMPGDAVVAGLSMGGGHAIEIGLKNVDRFSAIGAFSAATPERSDADLLKDFPALAGAEPAANQLRHFWIPIGTDDFLLKRNDKFTRQLKAAGIQHKYTKTDGGHEWRLWRGHFAQFLQMTLPANH